jgi:hypothetical protein
MILDKVNTIAYLINYQLLYIIRSQPICIKKLKNDRKINYFPFSMYVVCLWNLLEKNKIPLLAKYCRFINQQEKTLN